MKDFYSTREAAKKIGMRADTLQRAVWLGRTKEPQKSPSGHFLWTDEDINRASWALLGKAYAPEHDDINQVAGGVSSATSPAA